MEIPKSRFALALIVIVAVFTLTVVAMSIGIIEEHHIIHDLKDKLKATAKQGYSAVTAIPQGFSQLASMPYASGKHIYKPYRGQKANAEELRADRGPVGAQPPMFRYGVQSANSEILKQDRQGRAPEHFRYGVTGSNAETLKQNRLGANSELLKADRSNLGTMVATLDYSNDKDTADAFTDAVGVTLKNAYGSAYKPDAASMSDDPTRATVANAV